MAREKLIKELKRLNPYYLDELISTFENERIMRAIEHEKAMRNANYFRAAQEEKNDYEEYECGIGDNTTTYINGTRQRRRAYR